MTVWLPKIGRVLESCDCLATTNTYRSAGTQNPTPNSFDTFRTLQMLEYLNSHFKNYFKPSEFSSFRMLIKFSIISPSFIKQKRRPVCISILSTKRSSIQHGCFQTKSWTLCRLWMISLSFPCTVCSFWTRPAAPAGLRNFPLYRRFLGKFGERIVDKNNNTMLHMEFSHLECPLSIRQR